MAKEKPDYQDNKPYNHPIDQPMPSCHHILSEIVEDQNRSKYNKIESKMTIFGPKSPDRPFGAPFQNNKHRLHFHCSPPGYLLKTLQSVNFIDKIDLIGYTEGVKREI